MLSQHNLMFNGFYCFRYLHLNKTKQIRKEKTSQLHTKTK